MKHLQITILIIGLLIIAILLFIFSPTKIKSTENINNKFAKEKNQVDNNSIRNQKSVNVKLNKENQIEFISIDFENGVNFTRKSNTKIVDRQTILGVEKALLIHGGCGQPTLVIDLTNNEMKGTYELTYWAKVNQGSGASILIAGNSTWDDLKNDPEKQKEFKIKTNKKNIQSHGWKLYKEKLQLDFKKNDNVSLAIYFGGFDQSSMYLDNIQITKVNSQEIQTKAPQGLEDQVFSQHGRNILAFVPKGWHIAKYFFGDEPAIVKGDLNQDGLQDVAAVIEENSKTEAASPRSLIIALRNKDNSYTLSVKAEKAILKADEGGIYGDPFASLAIERGSLVINFYGGSSWRWENSYRFRYQNQGWYLIGATESFAHILTDEGAIYEDYNLLTGDYIKKETSEAGITKTTKINRGKKKLINLQDFEAASDKKF